MQLNEPFDCDYLICGDDKDAKAKVTPLIEMIPGVRVIDCGALEHASCIGKITPLPIGVNVRSRGQTVASGSPGSTGAGSLSTAV